jgi:hypothetical protein
MIPIELLLLMGTGAVLPYVAEAALDGMKKRKAH